MLFRKWRCCAEVREFKRADDSGEFGVVVDEGDDAHFSSTVGALQGVQFIELFDAPCPERGGFFELTDFPGMVGRVSSTRDQSFNLPAVQKVVKGRDFETLAE